MLLAILASYYQLNLVQSRLRATQSSTLRDQQQHWVHLFHQLNHHLQQTNHLEKMNRQRKFLHNERVVDVRLFRILLQVQLRRLKLLSCGGLNLFFHSFNRYLFILDFAIFPTIPLGVSFILLVFVYPLSLVFELPFFSVHLHRCLISNPKTAQGHH